MNPGTRLGPYTISAQIGEGGMGQVYRAHDAKLNRDVALKVLPPALAHDADRLARFTREAKLLASLNHPHIASIFGLEESGDLTAIVMELVEGEDLSQRIARGPLPLESVLSIARQIADGLAAAHQQGIIHRDLKPANIKIRPDGTVKILDFGLAKGTETADANARARLTHSPTITSPAMTQAGMILGTAAYMSPEQARGLPVGMQADVWAFGCIAFEMLTGTSPFIGPTVTDVLAAVVRAEPDWSALPSGTPSALRTLIRRCLRKDLSRRVHHIGDAQIELDEMSTAVAVPEPPRVTAHAAGNSTRIPWLVAGTLLLAVLVLAGLLATRSPERPVLRELRVDILTPNAADPLTIALSPDGLMLAYAARTETTTRLAVRSLADGSVKLLAGTDFASYPFWSPDNRSLGFFVDGKLKRLDVATGLTQVLAPAPVGTGATWSKDGVIVFAPTILGDLFKIPANGGDAVQVTTRVPGLELSHQFPYFLPDGRRFLYFVGNGTSNVRGVYLGSLDGPIEHKRLLGTDTAATLMGSNQLLFTRQGALFAQTLTERGELSGPPAVIANGVAFNVAGGRAAVTASPVGSVAYRTGDGDGRLQLQWADRTGRMLNALGQQQLPVTTNPSLSPDGRFVAVNGLVDNQDIWLLDTTRDTRRRFTVGGGTENQVPVWTGDGERIVWGALRNGAYDLFIKPAQRPGAEEELLRSNENKFPMGFSGDGRYLLYRLTAPNTNWDLWALPMSGEKKPFPVATSPFQEMIGELSQDGRWVAYQSNESGQFEIYVQSFPEPTARTQITSGGGSQPRWRKDGRELFFVGLDGRMMAVPISVNANQFLEAGIPTPLFMTRLSGGPVPSPQKQQYAVSADGQRFLLNTISDQITSGAVSLVINWDRAHTN